MTLSGSVASVDQAVNQVEWFAKSSAEYYCKMLLLVESGVVASKLAESVYQTDDIEGDLKQMADYSGLKIHSIQWSKER